MALLSTLLAAGLGAALSLNTQPSPTPGVDEIPFGTTYQGTRSTVMLSPPKEFNPSESALVDGDRPVATVVTVVNQGNDSMESFDFLATATCGGVDAPMIYDSAGGLNGSSPPGDILPGRKMQWPLGFAVVEEPCELIITLSFGSSDLYFVGKV